MGEDEVIEEVRLTDQVTYIVSRDARHVIEAQNEGDYDACSAADELKELAIATQALEHQGIFPAEVRIAIRTCQKGLRLKKQTAFFPAFLEDPGNLHYNVIVMINIITYSIPKPYTICDTTCTRSRPRQRELR